MKVSEDIRKTAAEVEICPEMDEWCLENLALRTDDVSKYAIALIVELSFANHSIHEEIQNLKKQRENILESIQAIRAAYGKNRLSVEMLNDIIISIN